MGSFAEKQTSNSDFAKAETLCKTSKALDAAYTKKKDGALVP